MVLTVEERIQQLSLKGILVAIPHAPLLLFALLGTLMEVTLALAPFSRASPIALPLLLGMVATLLIKLLPILVVVLLVRPVVVDVVVVVEPVALVVRPVALVVLDVTFVVPPVKVVVPLVPAVDVPVAVVVLLVGPCKRASGVSISLSL